MDTSGGFAFGSTDSAGNVVGGRACFNILRAPISIGDKTGQLIHDGQMESVYVSDACFDRAQTLTATGVPVGSYRLEGTLYAENGEIAEIVPAPATSNEPYHPVIARYTMLNMFCNKKFVTQLCRVRFECLGAGLWTKNSQP